MANVDIRLGFKSGPWFISNATLVLKEGQVVFLSGTTTKYKRGDGVNQLQNLPFSDEPLEDHIADTSNPHNVTKAQVGLGNVQNLDQTDPNNITQDATHRFVTDAQVTVWDANLHFRGKYISLVALQTAVPTANDGDYADVDPGAGTDAKRYIWDAQEGWVLAGDGTGIITVNGKTGPTVTLNTDDISEVGSPTNKWFTTARALATVLTGLSAASGTVMDTDTILQAFGKVKYFMDNLASMAMTFTNKTINGDNNFISNLLYTNLKTVAGNALKIVGYDKNGAPKLYAAQIFFADNVNRPITGTTSNTRLTSILIPGGTVTPGDTVIIENLVGKTTTAAATIRTYLNTVDSVVGGTQRLNASSTAASTWNKVKRSVFVRSATETLFLNVAAQLVNDETNNANGMTIANINWANDVYVVYAAQPGNVADTVSSDAATVMIRKPQN